MAHCCAGGVDNVAMTITSCEVNIYDDVIYVAICLNNTYTCIASQECQMCPKRNVTLYTHILNTYSWLNQFGIKNEKENV